MILQLSTGISDIILGLFALYYAYSLRFSGNPVARWWQSSFIALAFVSLFGGYYHILRIDHAEETLVWHWRIINLGIAMLSFSMLMAIFYMFRKSNQKNYYLIFLILVGSMVTLSMSLYSGKVFYLLLQYLSVFLILLSFTLTNTFKARKLIISSIVVTFVAAAVQQLDVSYSEIFNKNTIYHLVQIVAIFLLYRGIKEYLSNYKTDRI